MRAARWVAGCAVAASLVACGGGNKKSAEEPAAVVAEVAEPAKPAFWYLPATADFALGVDMVSLLASPLGAELIPLFRQQAGTELAEFTSACGFDPLDTVTQVVVGGISADEDKLVVEVKHKSGREQVSECMTKVAAAEGATLTVDGDTLKVASGDEAGITVAWTADDAFLMGPSLADLNARTGATDAKFTELFGRVDPSATFWMAMVLPPEASEQLGAMGAAPAGMFATAKLAEGISLEFGVRFADEQGASAITQQVTSMLPMMQGDPTIGKFLAKVQVTAVGSDMLVSLDLTEAEFTELVTQLPQLLMMMGLMGS